MTRPLLAFMILSLPLPVVASHTWSGIDICETFKDRLPPGLTLEALPEAASPGAGLLNRYCTQCHNLPGPDRHTAAEWHDLAPRMFLLMSASSRFGGLMGKVETIPPADQEILVAYLRRHASNTTGARLPGHSENQGSVWLSRGLALLPLVLLTGLGLWRWWLGSHARRKSCAAD